MSENEAIDPNHPSVEQAARLNSSVGWIVALSAEDGLAGSLLMLAALCIAGKATSSTTQLAAGECVFQLLLGHGIGLRSGIVGRRGM